MKKTKYLGTILTQNTVVSAEVRERIKQATITWKKLGNFWKKSSCTVRLKLIIYDAVIKSKVMYGLSSAQLNHAHLSKINTFQLRGLRQILKITTTYVN